MRATVEAVKAIGSPETSIVVLAKIWASTRARSRARVRKAIERGYLINNETKEKQPLASRSATHCRTKCRSCPAPRC